MEGASDDERVECARIFRLVDEDENGTVTKNEFRQLLHVLQPNATQQEMLAQFAAADSDGTQDIDFEEFSKFFTEIARGIGPLGEIAATVEREYSEKRRRREQAKSAWFTPGKQAAESVALSRSTSKAAPLDRTRRSGLLTDDGQSRARSRATSVSIVDAAPPSTQTTPAAAPAGDTLLTPDASSGRRRSNVSRTSSGVALIAPDQTVLAELQPEAASAQSASVSGARARALLRAEEIRRDEITARCEETLKRARLGLSDARLGSGVIEVPRPSRQATRLDLAYESLLEEERRRVLHAKQEHDRSRLRYALWRLETAAGAQRRPRTRWVLEWTETAVRNRAIVRESFQRRELAARAAVGASEVTERRTLFALAVPSESWSAATVPPVCSRRRVCRWVVTDPRPSAGAPVPQRISVPVSAFVSPEEQVWRGLLRSASPSASLARLLASPARSDSAPRQDLPRPSDSPAAESASAHSPSTAEALPGRRTCSPSPVLAPTACGRTDAGRSQSTHPTVPRMSLSSQLVPDARSGCRRARW